MQALDNAGSASSLSLSQRAIRVRCQQAAINELYKAGHFNVPIHLAFGHEPVAVGLAETIEPDDQVVLSHRNIHYQLAFGASASELVREYLLTSAGLAHGQFGSMNLINPPRGIVYTSSILGNNLPVAVGIALAHVVRSRSCCAWVVTGDGAMEEGAFAESLLLSSSLNLPLVTIVEDNGWSLATSISERRSPIALDLLVESYGVNYLKAPSSGVDACAETLRQARTIAVSERRPVVVHVVLETLGGRWIEDDASSGGRRFINYHAGPAPSVSLTEIAQVEFASLDSLAPDLAEPGAAEFIAHTIDELRLDLAWTTSLR